MSLSTRILVCGDRNWSDSQAIERELSKLPSDSLIIHGACRGADELAAQIAVRLGLKVLAFPAEWHRYGRAAGPIRNRRMLGEGRPDWVLAFHRDLARSKGTANMIALARKAGIPFSVFRE